MTFSAVTSVGDLMGYGPAVLSLHYATRAKDSTVRHRLGGLHLDEPMQVQLAPQRRTDPDPRYLFLSWRFKRAPAAARIPGR